MRKGRQEHKEMALSICSLPSIELSIIVEKLLERTGNSSASMHTRSRIVFSFPTQGKEI